MWLAWGKAEHAHIFPPSTCAFVSLPSGLSEGQQTRVYCRGHALSVGPEGARGSTDQVTQKWGCVAFLVRKLHVSEFVSFSYCPLFEE